MRKYLLLLPMGLFLLSYALPALEQWLGEGYFWAAPHVIFPPIWIANIIFIWGSINLARGQYGPAMGRGIIAFVFGLTIINPAGFPGNLYGGLGFAFWQCSILALILCAPLGGRAEARLRRENMD